MAEKTNVPKDLATPNDLKFDARQKVADALNVLVADTFALYIKTKNFHWHVSGPHFRDYHLLFDEHADQIFAMTDILAERVRKLGFTTIHSIKQISSLKTIEDDEEKFVEAITMTQRLLEDNKKLAHNLLEAHHLCDNAEDVATASLLETFIDETERRIWFLFEVQA